MQNLYEPPPRYTRTLRETTNYERNPLAALFHLFSLLFTTSALFYMTWFRIRDNHCTSQLALSQFMKLGYFGSVGRPNPLKLPGGELITTSIVVEYHTEDEVILCITPEVLNLIKVIITLCLLCIFYSMIGFCLDVIGPKIKILMFIRRHSLPSIWTLITVLIIMGFSYFVKKSLKIAIRNMYPNKPVLITYEFGWYAISAAGALSLLATVFNISQYHSPDTSQTLVDANPDDLIPLSINVRNIPPPPYTP